MFRRRLGVAVLVAAGALPLLGCKRAPAPPIEPFAPMQTRIPTGVIVKAPPVADHPWRVLMLQEHPRPKKNPLWRTIPVSESGSIEMPQGSHFKCIYNPVTFRSWENEHMKGIDKWDLLRAVRCSSDGWVTYSQAIHVISISGDGKSIARSIEQTELGLHELIDGKDVLITIAVRAD